MILVDANLLIYAYVTDYREHTVCQAWLNEQLAGVARVGIPWASLLAFLRLVTNPRLYRAPASIGAAWAQVEEWLDCPVVWVPGPTERHRAVFESCVRQSGVSGNLVPDAHLAALAIEHGLTLCSADGDFGRFSGLAWHNPLT